MIKNEKIPQNLVYVSALVGSPLLTTGQNFLFCECFPCIGTGPRKFLTSTWVVFLILSSHYVLWDLIFGFEWNCKQKWKYCNLLVSIRHYWDIVSTQFNYRLHITHYILHINTICKRKLISVNNFTWNYNICVRKSYILLIFLPL